MPGGIGAPEILLVVGALILIFGARRLPEIARSLGKARGEFKKGLQEGDEPRTEAQPREGEGAKPPE